MSFAITGASFAGNSVQICGARTPPADLKYLCNSSLSLADAGASACPCFNFEPDGTLVALDGGATLLTDLCASADATADASVDAGAAEWTFQYSIFDSPDCMGVQLNDGAHDFTCFALPDLPAQANPNNSVELLNPGVSVNQVICQTVNAFKTFNFESCTETCNLPEGGTLGTSCTQGRFTCGCALNAAGTCICGPDGGPTLADFLADLPDACAGDPVTCDILCPTP